MATYRGREGATKTRNSKDISRIEEVTCKHELRQNFFSQRPGSPANGTHYQKPPGNSQVYWGSRQPMMALF